MDSPAKLLRSSLETALVLNATSAPGFGTSINVGEVFYISIMVKNVSDTSLKFSNVTVKASKTQFATPMANGVAADWVDVSLSKRALRAGEYATGKVTMRATAALPEYFDRLENGAVLTCAATADLSDLLQITKTKTVLSEIEPT